MGHYKIKTDHKWHDFVYRYDVPEGVLAKEFDWLDEDAVDGYFKFKGSWYHLSQFERIKHEKDSAFSGWDGNHSYTWSSGVVISLSPDGEQYKVGSYIYYS